MPPALLLLGDLLNEDIVLFFSILLVMSLAELTDVIFKLNRLLGIRRFDRGDLDTRDISRDNEIKNFLTNSLAWAFSSSCLR